MKQFFLSRLSHLFTILLWIALFVFLMPAYAPQPLMSGSEDKILLFFMMAILIVQVGWKWFGRTIWSQILPVVLWIYLFIVAGRGLSIREIGQLGWFSTLLFALVLIAGSRRLGTLFVKEYETWSKSKFELPRFVVAALAAGALFLLFADLMLVMIQPSAIPIAIPEFWLERIGFLWPLVFMAIIALRLSGIPQYRRGILLVLLVFCIGLEIKEQNWSRQLKSSLSKAQSLIDEGRISEAQERLAQVRQWNGRKQIPDVEPSLHRAMAQIYLRKENPLGTFFELKRYAQSAPWQIQPLLDEAGSSIMDQVAQIPLTPLNDLQLMVDIEPASSPDHFYLLDRWGRVFLNGPEGIRSAFEDPPRAIEGGDEPADLEIMEGETGAIVMSKRGKFHFRGKVSPRIRKLLEEASVPAQTYVDFELSPSRLGAYLLSDRGPIISIGQTEVAIADQDQVQWLYSIARDLEVSPDGLGLYLMDGLGSVHTLGQTTVDTEGPEQPYWLEERAVDIEWLPSGKGFYLLANFGGIYVVGSPEVRKEYQIPEKVQKILGWSYAIAFLISPDEQEICVLESNGGIDTIQRQTENPQLWLARIQRQIEDEKLLDAVQTTNTFLEIAPEWTEATLNLLDATFCRNLSNLRLSPWIDPQVAVDVEQTGSPGNSVILDRWGRLWNYNGSTYRLLKPPSVFSPESGRATDLEWIPSASAALILYDRGGIEPWGPVPYDILSLIENYQPEGEGWIDLEPTADGNGFVLANAYGGFREIGSVKLSLPGVGGFAWGEERLGRDMELSSQGDCLYFLDVNGSIHPFGNNRIFTRGEEAPYWSEAFASGLALYDQEQSIYLLTRSGLCYSIGSATSVSRIFTTQLEETMDFEDIELSPDETYLTFLEGNYRVTTLAQGKGSFEYYTRRLKTLVEQNKNVEALLELDAALKVVKSSEERQQLVDLLSPRWFLSLKEELPRKKLSLNQQYLRQRFFGTYLGPFVDSEIEGSGSSAFLLDLYGRIYRYTPQIPEEYQVIDTTVLPTLEQARAIDFERWNEGEQEGLMILDDRGSVHFRLASPDPVLEKLVEQINSDPVLNALDLEIAPGQDGAIIMNRGGHLKTYGNVSLPEVEIERIGWYDYEIARDMEFTPEGRGLYLLDGMGAVHALGETSVPTRAGTLDDLPWFGKDIAQAITNPSKDGFWLLDRYGRVHPWAEVPFDRPSTAALPLWLLRGERPVDVESNDSKDLWVMSNWGRMDYFQKGSEGWAYHRAVMMDATQPVERLCQLYKMITADPGRTQAILDEIDPGWFIELSRQVEFLPDDLWMAYKDAPEILEKFSILTDILPGPSRNQAYLLNRWGQIYLWDHDRQKVLEILRRKSLPDPDRKKAVAFVSRPTDPDQPPSFLIMDSTGELYLSGEFPGVLENGIHQSKTNLHEAMDLALSENQEAVFLLDSTGQVKFVGRSGVSPSILPGHLWSPGVARSLVLEDQGFYLLDRQGVVHPFGQTRIPKAQTEVVWFAEDEARVLRADPTENGLLLAGRKGDLYPIASPETEVPEASWPEIHFATGEELMRMEWDRVYSQLWGLTNRSRIFRIPVGFRGAEEYCKQAAQYLSEKNPLDAYSVIVDAVKIAPERTRDLLKDLGPRLTEALLNVPDWQCENVEAWVDVEIRETAGDCWILNRWGEIYKATPERLDRPEPGNRERVRIKESSYGTPAVDFILHPVKPVALVLYSDGFLEVWGGSLGEELDSAITQYNQDPLVYAIDLEWAPGNKGFYVTSSRGKLKGIGEQSFPLALTRKWYWEEDVVKSLKASPDGQALFLFDHLGGVHLAGQSQIDLQERKAPYFKKPGMAIEIEEDNRGQGFYFLDALGALHTIGHPGMLPRRGTLPYFHVPSFVDFEIGPEGEVVLLSKNGRLYRSDIPKTDHE